MVWGKCLQPDVILKVDTFCVFHPSLPCSLLFVPSSFCNPILSCISAAIRSAMSISLAGGEILKEGGTWVG